MNTINRVFSVLLFITTLYTAKGQVYGAKITYERKTNLYKKFTDSRVQKWIKEEEKIKIDFFELFVSDTFSLFKPQESELREMYSWATTKNTVYQDFNRNIRYLIKSLWGEELHLTDTLYKRKWHITESTRKIAGYHCRKAVWRANDSTRIYAWFSYDIVPSTGPETFNGLPGTILGLATENGSVVYFAKKVEIISPEASLFKIPKKKKIYSIPELKERLTKEYGKEKWFPEVFAEHFTLW